MMRRNEYNLSVTFVPLCLRVSAFLTNHKGTKTLSDRKE